MTEPIVVDYIEEGTGMTRTAVVPVPDGDPRLIPFVLREQGRKPEKVLKYNAVAKPGEVKRWT